MSIYEDKLYKYCDDILSGRIVAGVYTIKAIKRFYKDLKRQKNNDFNFEYHQEFADKICEFAESLKPGDMNGKKIKLIGWQIFCLSNLEGWTYKGEPRQDPETGLLIEEGWNRKRFRNGYIEVNRKNGKTTGILEPMILYNFIKYPASESYLVSSRDDLAEKTFKEIIDIINADEALNQVLQPRSLTVTFKDPAEKSRLSFFCDGGKDADGFKPRFYCIDEYHAHQSDKMYTSMQYGTRSKADAQGVIITTADTCIDIPCYEMNQKARRILNGIQTQEDFFTIIYAIDENDDYKNPKVWQKANPSLYEIINPDVIQADVDDALNEPAKIPELKAKTFGIWGGGGLKTWIPLEIWEKNKSVNIDFDSFTGAFCFGGLDLSQIDDMTAFSLVFSKENKFYFKHHFYIPEDTAAERYRKENSNFYNWIDQGIITPTPGNTVDYDFILKDIIDEASKYNLIGLGYDRWQSMDLIRQVDKKRPDINLIEVEQSLKKLSPITKAYEKAIRDGIIIDNNPAMAWMITNAEIHPDANGNYKPVKPSKTSTRRIDGVISSMMSYSLITNPDINTFLQDPVKHIEYNILKALF